MHERQLLKKDLFGEVWRSDHDGETRILRETAPAHWSLRAIARALMRREARALLALDEIAGVPKLLRMDNTQLQRNYLSGAPLYKQRTTDAQFYRAAMRLLRRLHTAGVTHNDLAKEPNVLVLNDGSPAFIDFQLASCTTNRGRLFRIAAREDIRHLLKHKRTYASQLLTAREKRILNTPSVLSLIWMKTFKPVYLVVTRRLLGWADREGAMDRNKID